MQASRTRHVRFKHSRYNNLSFDLTHYDFIGFSCQLRWFRSSHSAWLSPIPHRVSDDGLSSVGIVILGLNGASILASALPYIQDMRFALRIMVGGCGQEECMRGSGHRKSFQDIPGCILELPYRHVVSGTSKTGPSSSTSTLSIVV